MLLGRRSIRLAAPLTLLSCCRASARLQHTGAALLARSAHGRHHDVAMRSALLTRLRGGNMTTDAGAEAGKPIVIETLDDFETALQDADDKLVVVDFTATWCARARARRAGPHTRACSSPVLAPVLGAVTGVARAR